MTAAPSMSEDDLLGTVLDMASTLGIRTAHFRPAKTDKGWRTPVSGDGKGWPDLVLVGCRVLFRELKSARGVPSSEQKLWLAALSRAGQDAGVWQPADLRSGRILAELRAIRVPAEAVNRIKEPTAPICVCCLVRPGIAICCSSHMRRMCHTCYRQTHFVEVCRVGCGSCESEGLDPAKAVSRG